MLDGRGDSQFAASIAANLLRTAPLNVLQFPTTTDAAHLPTYTGT